MSPVDNNARIENSMEDCSEDYRSLLQRIENAYKVYKISELFLNDVTDDYGKIKIARLRLEFACHELRSLLNEAAKKGIKLSDNEFVRRFINNE